jgi:hypothetical protein
VDVAGRTRLEWLAAHPDWPLSCLPLHPDARSLDAADYVRPSEPMVFSKLSALIDGLAKQPSADGIAVIDWEPSADRNSILDPADSPPSLGYAYPERVAFLKEYGTDPIDEPAVSSVVNASFTPRIFQTLGATYAAYALPDANAAKQRTNPWGSLAARVVARARSARPDWSTWLVNRRPSGSPLFGSADLPKTDHLLDVTATIPSRSGYATGYLLPIPPVADVPAAWLAERGYHPVADLLKIWYPPTFQPPKEIVLDFRAAPEEIRPALRLIKRAKDGPETVVGSASARDN